MMAMLSQHDDNAILPPPQGDDAVIDMQWCCHNYAMTIFSCMFFVFGLLQGEKQLICNPVFPHILIQIYLTAENRISCPRFFTSQWRRIKASPPLSSARGPPCDDGRLE